MKLQTEFFKWLYEKGFNRSNPEMMNRAAAKLLEVRADERADEPPQVDELERTVRRLEETINGLVAPPPARPLAPPRRDSQPTDR